MTDAANREVPVCRTVVERGAVLWQDPCAAPAPWWSLTKTAMAAAALVLADRRLLYLDRPLAGRPYTLRHLLQHTSGLPDYGGFAAYHRAVAEGAAPWPEQHLLDRLEVGRLRSAPGERFVYSNIGYLLVRRLLEQTTGTILGNLLDELVFGPLGIDGVQIATEPSDLTDTLWGNADGYHPGWVYHGLAVGTPTSAALFIDRLLEGRLLAASSLAALQRRFPVSDEPLVGRPWRSAGYGLGLMIDLGSPSGSCYGHTGGGPGSTTATYRFAATDPVRTVSVFARTEEQGWAERQALALAVAT